MTGFSFTTVIAVLGLGAPVLYVAAHAFAKVSDKVALKSSTWRQFFGYQGEEIAALKKAPLADTAGAWNLNQKIFSTRVSQIKEFRKVGESK